MYTLPGLALADIPVIETDQFRLRPGKLSDFPRLQEMWEIPEYFRFIGNQPRPPGYNWAQIQKNIGSWALLGFGYWTIAEPETDAFMGECGFTISKRAEIRPALRDIPEAGWGIRPEYWGKGITKAAMKAAVSWAREQDADFPFQCIISADHKASASVARSLGMSIVRTVPYDGKEDDPIDIWENVSTGDAA